MMNFRDERSALIDEVKALRAQVQELTALGVSLHKAGDDGYRQGYTDGKDDERDAVVEWLRMLDDRWGLGASVCGAAADAIERGAHREDKP